jgi:hypothetical protein
MPPLRNGKAIAANRLIAILQGWDAKKGEIDAQVRASRSAGASGFAIAMSRIDQSWEPRLIHVAHRNDSP